MAHAVAWSIWVLWCRRTSASVFEPALAGEFCDRLVGFRAILLAAHSSPEGPNGSPQIRRLGMSPLTQTNGHVHGLSRPRPLHLCLDMFQHLDICRCSSDQDCMVVKGPNFGPSTYQTPKKTPAPTTFDLDLPPPQKKKPVPTAPRMARPRAHLGLD